MAAENGGAADPTRDPDARIVNEIGQKLSKLPKPPEALTATTFITTCSTIPKPSTPSRFRRASLHHPRFFTTAWK